MPTSESVLAAACLSLGAVGAMAQAPRCKAESATALVPVIELYTSEGCSSCPPADRWLSTLKAPAASGRAVVQAFHVGYWDYIGWVDRFASPAHTTRQRQIAGQNGLSGVYTPQVVRHRQDWREWGKALEGREPARARIALQKKAEGAFEALVTPAEGVGAWSPC